MSSISRRNLLSALAAAPVLGAVPRNPDAPGSRPMNVVVSGGHPGDPEYGCGGTVARLTDAGHNVTLLYLNSGQKSCPEQPGDRGSTVRTAEAQNACQILKAHPKYAGQCDGNAVVDQAHYAEFETLMRGLTPDLVFTQWPLDGHRDHRATFNLVYESWLRMKKQFALYFYEVSDGEDTQMFFTPSHYVDITAAETRKREACYAHASQSPDRFYALQSAVAKFRGIESGYQQAEAFIEHLGSPHVALP